MKPGLIWHAYPLGLLGAGQSGEVRDTSRTLSELVDWLPHVRTLGADTVLLGPIFRSLSHGYDTVTHREIDERLGTIDDFDALVGAAREAGVGIVLDGAFAYASRRFWRLADPDEARQPWFLRDDDGELVPWRVDSLVTPDYGSAAYQDYVVEVLGTWLDRGIAGWRLDSAWSVPAAFWRRVLARVRTTHPQAWLLGQVFDDDLSAVINSATFSSATEYALMHGVRDWLAGGAPDTIVDALAVHARNSTRNPVHTFVGNHDFARLTDVVTERLVPPAFAIAMTLPGVPAVYYGDEVALTSAWAQGGSDALLRPAFRLDELGGGVLDAVRTLGSLRAANPWLARAAIEDVSVRDEVLGYQVSGDGSSWQVTVDRGAAQVTVADASGTVATVG